MPDSPLQNAGAQIGATAAAALHTNEFFTGVWTQGNPLGPGAVPFIYARYWGASRYDRLVGGVNVEISTRLTPIRRCGSSVYNDQLFPPINRFFEWRGFSSQGERIRLMASCDTPGGSAGGGTVRDATGPSTNLIVQTKAANAGRTSFVAVGNNLYWGDGAETGMMTQTMKSWEASTQFANGDVIVDSNGNLQTAVVVTSQIVQINVTTEGGTSRNVKLFLAGSTPWNVPDIGTIVGTLAGLTTRPTLNGLSMPPSIINPLELQYRTILTPVTTGTVAETGTVTTGNGISGSTEPAWATAAGALTFDAGVQWVNSGPAVMPWGSAAPTQAPTVSQIPAPLIYPRWAHDTWYAPLFIILDGAGNQQKLTTAGVTGSSIPTFATTVGATTTDGTAVWTCLGPANWAASTAYHAGDEIQVTFTYTITNTVTKKFYNPDTGQFEWGPVTTTVTTTSKSLFQALQDGTSGPAAPNWIDGVNTNTIESTGLVWENLGPVTNWPGATQTLSLDTIVLDNAGFAQQIQAKGKSGATEPSPWAAQGGLTVDNTATWLNQGPVAAAHTNPWIYAYSGKISSTGFVSTASPLSIPFTPGLNSLPVVQGLGLPFPPYDTIVLWRTLEGGSDEFYLDEFPNPGAGQNWTYTDTTPDLPSAASNGLNQFILAPIAGMNDPPPANFVPQAYYLGRIWGFAGNVLMYSNGPDQGAVAGSGDQGFTSLHRFTLPSTGITCWPTTIGLVCFTNSDMWIVLGQGTYDQNDNPVSPFYIVQFQQNCGISSKDAFGVNGSTGYIMLNSRQVVSIDPGAGELEVGFPIGDQFDNYYDPANTWIVWHQARSADTALYVANGAEYWYRMAAAAAPESGNVWSLPALIAAPGKVKAIASIETSPGIKALVIGPSVNGNPILMRDLSVSQDAGVSYPASMVIAPVTLAGPGSTVGLQYVVTEEKLGGTALTVGLIFDEISGSDFRRLRNITPDPPTQPYPTTFTVQRHWAAQDANTVVRCRLALQLIDWGVQNFQNELYTNTLYGRVPEKARK